MASTTETSRHTARLLTRFLLYGNYFLAFCIVALSIETTVKLDAPIRNNLYYVLVFLSVVVYYTHAYISDAGLSDKNNPRSQWYHQNRKLVSATQVIYTILVAGLAANLVYQYRSSLSDLKIPIWCLLFIFPVTALLYYSSVFPKWIRFPMRNIAWLKPFIIGFVCTGAIVIYPLVFHSLQVHEPFRLSLANGTYFLTNWLFTTAIAIMFDIKDFSADHNYHLKTFVVEKGLRFTIFYVLIPLSAGGIISFLTFAVLRHFTIVQILVNIIPFLLLLYVSAFFRRRHGILYYLVVIDGLLLVKAIFGILTMTL